MAAVAIAFALLVGTAGAARADDPDLAVTGRTRLVHDPSTALVHATLDLTLTNRKPSTSTRFYYFTAYAMPIQAGSLGLRVTSGTERLRAATEHTDDPTIDLLRVDLGGRLLFGQSRRLRVTYDVTGAPPRSDNQTRIGVGYATFPALAPGDMGHNRLEIVLPAEMEWDSPDADLFTEERSPQTAAGGQRLLVATEPNTADGFYVPFSAQVPGALLSQTARVAGDDVQVLFWPGDKEWATSVTKTLVDGVPALVRITGQPWPDDIRTVREDSGTGVFGYDGYYDNRAHEIVLSDSHEPHLVLHELAHAFSNTDLFDARWLSEGLAEFLATRAAGELGVRDVTFDPVSRKAKDALPLQQWTWPKDDISGDSDAYAYPAAGQAMTALLGSATPQQLRAVVADVRKGASGYDGSEASLFDDTSTRRFLDIVEAHVRGSGPTAAYRTWVVPPSESGLLAARTASRTAWARIDRSDGAWKPPIAYLRALTEWDFGTADSLARALGPVATSAGRVQDAARTAGVQVPVSIRQTYEQANGADDIERAGRILSRAVAAVPRIAHAERAVTAAEDNGPLVAFAAERLGVRRDLEAASAALASGDGDPAALAQRAADRASWALPLAVAGLVGGVLLAFALAWVVTVVVAARARRRA
jgi:hypothetical protein